ncbi:MAG TPA: DUF4932 domain-containing protein [bacterium]|nr:DUF4932 domain-containing protein [bacterium]
MKDDERLTVTFLSDVDSLSFVLTEGSYRDFIIEHGADRCRTRLVGVRAVPAAVFDAAYQAEHDGKIAVEIPEMYELVNIAMAVTNKGLGDRSLFYHDSDYHAAVVAFFDHHREEPVIEALDAALRQNPGLYSSLKMNAYSYEFDVNGWIVQSKVYDRTAFPGEKINTLLPYIKGLQKFADHSNFQEFYRRNRRTYDAQIAFYRDEADVGAMLAWLGRNFPGTSPYNTYKIIFSPLVAYNQSSTWLESNGFRELQAHVNYPYPEDLKRRAQGVALSKQAETMLRSFIVFTELNHGFINPLADKFAERVAKAIDRREHWVDSSRGAGYYPGISTFNEYMNWALVSIWISDSAPAEEQALLIQIVDDMMAKRRGFPRFAVFDAYLLDLYRTRQANQTIADLYPRIIEWFERENAEGRQPQPASEGPTGH